MLNVSIFVVASFLPFIFVNGDGEGRGRGVSGETSSLLVFVDVIIVTVVVDLIFVAVVVDHFYNCFY